MRHIFFVEHEEMEEEEMEKEEMEKEGGGVIICKAGSTVTYT